MRNPLFDQGQHGAWVEGGALVDRVHTIEESTAEVQEALKDLIFDYVVDLHNNVRSRSIKRTLGLISFTGPSRIGQMAARTRLAPHAGRLHCRKVRRGLRRGLALWFPRPGRRLRDKRTGGVAADLCRSGHWRDPFWKATYPFLMQTIVDRSDVPVVLIGGGRCQKGQGLEGSNVISLVGKTTLAESAGVLRGAQHVYAGDTGMMHLAAAVETPVTSFWGCTARASGWRHGTPLRVQPSPSQTRSWAAVHAPNSETAAVMPMAAWPLRNRRIPMD